MEILGEYHGYDLNNFLIAYFIITMFRSSIISYYKPNLWFIHHVLIVILVREEAAGLKYTDSVMQQTIQCESYNLYWRP